MAAYTYYSYTGDGVTNNPHTFGFNYRSTADIVVKIGGSLQVEGAGNDYTFPNATQVQMTAAVPDGSLLTIERNTSQDTKLVTFTAGTLTSVDLNAITEQLFFMAQEALSGIVAGATINNAANVTYNPAGASALATNVQAQLRQVVSVKDFGAVGDGVTDDTAAIAAAFTYAGTFTNGCEIVFPNDGDSIYLIGYGFVVPTKCRIKLNGCTIKTTTTWNTAQPTPAFPGTFRAVFCVIGSLTGGASLGADVEDISIIGDGAVIDMRYDDQTGTRQGASGIRIETTPAPIVGNLWKVHDILVKDVTVKNCLWYSFSVTDSKNVVFQNCKSISAWNLGFVVVSGWNVTHEFCEASYTRNGAGNQGVGFWNEANETWQLLRNIRYHNCLAEFNNRSGFKYYNDGKDVEVSVFAFGNISRSNQWDTATSAQTSSTSDAGHIVCNKTLTGTKELLIKLVGCVAEEEYNAGFKVTRVSGGNARQNVLLEDCTAWNCNKEDVSTYSRACFHVVNENDSPVYISNPLVIAPSGNSNGYAIGLEHSKEVYVTTPRFVGTFEYQLITGNVASIARKTAGWDVAWDDTNGGHTGGGTKFYKPVRLTSFDQTAEPTAGTDTYDNELAVWQDDNNQFHGIYTRDDSSTPKYLDFRAKKRIRATVAISPGTIAAQNLVSGTTTVTGAALGDIVQFSYTTDLQNAGSGPELYGNVTAADTVRWTIANHSTASRAVPDGTVVINVIGSAL